MAELVSIGLGAAGLGWWLLAWALGFAKQEFWLGLVFAGFFGLIFLGVGWKALHQAMLVMLGLANARLARRDFRNSLADWLMAARTGFKD